MQNQILDLTKTLKQNLEGADRVSILGIGSELRGDDVAGMLVVQALQKKLKAPHVQLLEGFTAPENMTGEIKKFKPSHLILIDAADISSEPGTIMCIPSETVFGVSFSTHMMPLKMMIDYLNTSFPCNVLIIGIQPKSIHFGAEVSKEINKASGDLAEALLSILQ